MATIRPLRHTDTAAVEYVCRMTAGEIHQKEPVIGNILAKMFSTYYARECCDTSFVLADDNDVAVGYVMCEPDYKRYGKLFRKIDTKNIWALDKKSGFDAWWMPFPYFFLGLKYPAHLHIDILPEYQGQGYGAQMMTTMLDNLKRKNVRGIMLMAHKDNHGAIRFYERLGFKVLFNGFGGVVMAKNLKD